MASVCSSIDLSVVFGERSLRRLKEVSLDKPWHDMMKNMSFSSRKPPMVMEDLAFQVEAYLEKLWQQRHGEKGAQLQVQVVKVANQQGTEMFEFKDEVNEHLRPGDTVTMEIHTNSLELAMTPRFSQELIELIRSRLRFDLNERVVCNCGTRWLSGHIVGTAVPDPADENILAYTVRPDAHPGIPSEIISVPSDNDKLCVQEVCFDPDEQLLLVRSAASAVRESSRPKLRFALGDKVVCRIRNDTTDNLETWLSGSITAVWPNIGDALWDMDGSSGKFPDVVPYKVEFASGRWVYCHRDVHTLIRAEGMQPVTRVKGISKRMEVLKDANGTKFVVDHATGRRKRSLEDSDSDSATCTNCRGPCVE